MLVIGIDPGLDGALATLSEGILLDVMDIPTSAKTHGTGREINPHILRDVLRSCTAGYPRISIVIERVSARPGQGVTSMFSFGRSLGVIEGVCAWITAGTAYVTPQKWKTSLGLKGKDKDAARTLAMQLYPESAGYLRRKKDVGRADAILIAHYWREKHVQKQ